MEYRNKRAERDEQAYRESGEKCLMIEIFGAAFRNGKEDQRRQSQIDEELVERCRAEGRHELKTFCKHAQKDQHEHGQQQ